MIFIAQLSKALAQKRAKISRVAQSKPLRQSYIFFLKHSKTIRSSLSVDGGVLSEKKRILIFNFLCRALKFLKSKNSSLMQNHSIKKSSMSSTEYSKYNLCR